MYSRAFIKKTAVFQHDQSDCGVACLLSILKYYGGTGSLDHLREISGTNSIGTTLLGLYQAANKIGFNADAFKGDIPNLKKLSKPCILHIVNRDNFEHYIVCYGYINSKFRIFDPALGIIEMQEEVLEKIWNSKALLTVTINEQFETKKKQKKDKWKWFWSLIEPDTNILIVSMVLGLILTLLGLSTAIFSQKLIDDILPSGDKDRLIIGLILFLFILFIKSLFAFIRQHFLLMQTRDFNNRIITNFFTSLVNLPLRFFDTHKTGDMITRMHDTNRIQRNIAYIASSVFIDIVIILSTSFFLINYSLTIALVAFCFIPVIVFVIVKFTKPIRLNQQEIMIADSVNESNYIDSIQGISVVKEYLKETVFIERIKSVYNNLQMKNLDLGNVTNKFNLTMDTLSIILTIILTTISSFFVLDGLLKTGEMIAIISLSGTLMPAVSRLSQVNLHFQEASVALDRMYDFTSLKPEFRADRDLLSDLVINKITVENLSFRFPGRKAILENINFEVRRGEMIALLGESGCGKSTTFSLIRKFNKVDQGMIRVNGADLEGIFTPDWRSVIACVPQEIKLFNGSLIDNIAVNSLDSEISMIIDFCKNYGFNTFFESFPQGYLTKLGEDGVNLSGGQKQMVALARALYRKPQLLLLDEATSAMDRRTESFVLKLLNSLQKKMAIIFITHKFQITKMVDRIYIIESGKVTDSGIPKELLLKDNFYSQVVADL